MFGVGISEWVLLGVLLSWGALEELPQACVDCFCLPEDFFFLLGMLRGDRYSVTMLVMWFWIVGPSDCVDMMEVEELVENNLDQRAGVVERCARDEPYCQDGVALCNTFYGKPSALVVVVSLATSLIRV